MTEKSKENLKFSAEISKVLKLMIHSLYTNKDIFLRELISNAADACDKLRYTGLTTPALLEDGAPTIGLSIDKKNRTLTVSDTGIGMSREELISNLGTIAKSGTQEFLAQLTGDQKKDVPLIGQFGVGFYSAFMVADKVTVLSTKAGSSETWQWESAGEGEFSLEPTPTAPRGTRITLQLKPDAETYLDKFKLRHIITTYSDHIPFAIMLTDEESHSEQINTASALWMRPKADITEEQYKEFYHHVAHAPDDPWLTLHNRAEGKLEYVNLLFIPSMKPFDLFHPDRKRRVKLYVRRVFITEENVDVVPAYMRFLRGVVDSEDLPLNISRETLQANPMLAKIRESLVKRVLSELKKKSQESDYEAFWKNFGPILKEGLCEAATPREQILEVCRFYTSLPLEGGGQGGGQTSLDDYLSRMKSEQENIFYLTGENLEALRASPQLEGFKKHGIEVVLMNDHVDDFWVNVVTDYKGKKLKSVTRADIDLDKISGGKTEDKKPETKTDNENIKTFCARIKAILGDKVKDVRTTDKLTSSAMCLGVEEGAMDLRLERFLVEQKQIAAASAKILEINPEHPIIQSLMQKMDTAESGDVIWLLFDQARIVEGETVSDPAGFTRRLQRFVEKSLAA